MGVLKGSKLVIGLILSLCLGVIEPSKLNAAEKLEVQFDGMSIPISVKELVEWTLEETPHSSELNSWLTLLDKQSRKDFLKLLRAPIVKDQSMGRQILQSWVGRQLLDQLSDLILLDDDSSGERVLITLELLLEIKTQVSTLDLLEALPAKSIRLDLDELLKLANQWKYELNKQQQLVMDLEKIPLKIRSIVPKKALFKSSFRTKSLTVNHRPAPLKVEIWRPNRKTIKKKNWILFMTGLGGSQEHFRWLAKALSSEGWPIVILDHPGSDDQAVLDLLEGRRSLPGAEVLPERLADLNAVLLAKKNGLLRINGEKVVLMGHSLGALTGLLAAGAVPPQPSTELLKRCSKALDALSLTNLSQFLQCQMLNIQLPKNMKVNDLDSIIAINSFGSLLWPIEEARNISIPALFIGGTLDLITPPIQEQLGLLLALTKNESSRALLVQGASHFSPVRVKEQSFNNSRDDLFRLGEALVGVQPIDVQKILSTQIINFMQSVDSNKSLDSLSHEVENDLHFYIMDRQSIKNLVDF